MQMEITENLLPGQDATYRPDLVARVFDLKLKQLFKEMRGQKDTHGVFGQEQAIVHVTEFQKRDLPHAHILLIMHPDHRPKSPQDVDLMISVELPDKTTDKDLYDVVTKFMLHGPCGPNRPTSSCMKDGRCTKHYPRPLCEETQFEEDGYPTYRRRDLPNAKFTKRGETLVYTNKDVVPYNPYLSRRFECHINAEVTVGSVGSNTSINTSSKGMTARGCKSPPISRAKQWIQWLSMSLRCISTLGGFPRRNQCGVSWV
jgi:hypothetical protein